MRERDAEARLLGSDGLFDTYDLPSLNVSMRRVRPELDSPALHAALVDTVARIPLLPGVARIAAAERDETSTYLIGPPAKGGTYADRIANLAPLSPTVALEMIRVLLKALRPLHERGLAHGDLRPENVLFLSNGDVALQVPCLFEAYPASRRFAQEWYAKVKPYLAPEVRLDKDPDPATDVYAVGVIFHQLLTGKLPDGTAPKVPAALLTLLSELTGEAAGRPADATAAAERVEVAASAVRFGRTPKPKAKPDPADPLPEPVVIAQAAPERTRDVPGCLLLLLGLSALVCAIMVGTFLLYDRQRPPLVRVPAVEGLTEEQAERVVKDAKLRFVVASRRPSDKVPQGKVLDSTPAAGARIPGDGTVNVAVSDGPSIVKVPDLVGMMPDKAVATIREAGLKPTPLPDPVPSSVAEGKVARQEPAEGAKVDRDTEVKFSVSGGKTAVTGPTYTAEVTVRVTGVDEKTRVRIDVEDAEGVRKIHDESHDPDDRIPLKVRVRGRNAVFKVYYDDRPVATIDKELAP